MDQNENGYIDKSHALFLLSRASANFVGAVHRISLDEFDFGLVDFQYFAELMYGGLSTQQERYMEFLECIHSTMILLAAHGGIHHQSIEMTCLTSLDENVPTIANDQEEQTGYTTPLTVFAGSENEEDVQQTVATNSVRRSSRILNASNLMQMSLEQEEPSGLTDFVRISKSLLELRILSHRQKLKLIEEFLELEDGDRLAALFHFQDLDGDGKINALELADAICKYVDADDGFGNLVRIAVESVTKFDADGDAMLDLQEFQPYVQDFADKIEQPFNIACEIFMMKLLLSDFDSEELQADFSAERVTEEVLVREALNSRARQKRLNTLFGLLDIDACDSITGHEAFIGLSKIVETVSCERRDTLRQWVEALDEKDCRLDLDEFRAFTADLVIACAPLDPLAMFDAIVSELTKCLLRELIPGEFKCAAAA